MKNLLILIFTFSFSILYSQSPIQVGLKNYRDFRIPEKVFIHTDKDIYAGGETIWMAAYLVDGQTHLAGTVTNTLKIELRNIEGEVVLNQILFSDQGHSSGDFLIPTSMQPGDYQIVAYTNFQLNSGNEFLFRKNIQIITGIQAEEKLTETLLTSSPSRSSSIITKGQPKNNIRFFPEGGDCVSGIPCRMAFVIENESIKPNSTSGYLVNQSGKKLIKISSNEFGVGRLKYLPKEKEEFWIELSETNEKIKLPQPISKGYHLNIKQEQDSIKIFAKTNLPNGINGSRIVLHLRGMLLVDKKIESKRSFMWLKVGKESIQPGVVVCTLFDEQDSPVAERLFFISPDIADSQLEISLDQETLETRQENKIKFQTLSESNTSKNLDSSRISVSIIPNLVNTPIQSGDIRTWLLLNSDVNLSIPFATDLIFGKKHEDQLKIIDDFMMTRGWRRFRWKSVINSENLNPTYEVERGILIKGRMGVYEKPNKPRPGKIFLSQPKTSLSEEKMTDINGNFEFGPYGFFDTLDVYLEGRYKAGRRNRLNPKITRENNSYVFLETIKNEVPKIPFTSNYQKSKMKEELILAYQELSDNKLTIARKYDSLSIMLSEIEVKTRRISPEEEKRKERTLLYQTPSNRLVVNDLPGGRTARTTFDLLRRIPGVMVSGFGGQETALIRGVGALGGSNTPVYFLDGFPVDEGFIRDFPVENIEFIDVLKTGRAAVLGSRAANGAILIYSKVGSSLDSKPITGLLRIKVKGFYRAREFSVFDAMEEGNQNRPDIRTTIHWNPNLRTNSKGIVEENFITSDQTGKFIIIAQGLQADGKPLFGTKEFSVEE
ncbi:MAG: TonB-dependent receptor plug domain-containing protein [Saprospiraceae bacterium]